MTIKRFKENLDTLLEIAGCTEEEELYFVVTDGQHTINVELNDIKLILDSDKDIKVELKVNYN